MKRVLCTGLLVASVLFVRNEAGASQPVLRNCVGELNYDLLPLDYATYPSYQGEETWTSVNSMTSDDSDICWNYTWVEAISYNSLTVNRVWSDATPGWIEGGSNDSCGHSYIEYALYSESPQTWIYHGGGKAWGKWVNGVCTYSVSNWPKLSYGTDSVTAYAGVGHYRIAIRHWSHNHAPGTNPTCTDPTNCYWATYLQMTHN